MYGDRAGICFTVLTSLLLASATLAHAGELPNAPSADRQQAARLFSRQNVAAFTINAGLRTADAALTCRNLNRGGREYEAPMQTCAANAAFQLAMIPAQIGAVKLLQHYHHYKLARIAAWGFPAADAPSVVYSATH